MTPEADTLFLHGFTGHADAWDATRSRLRARGLAVTLHGHDFAKGTFAESTFDAESDRIAAVAQRRGRVRLCGYSMGGRIALAVLARYPEFVTSAVLIGASPGLRLEAERVARRADDARWADLLNTGGITAFARAWEGEPLFASQRSLPPGILARQRAHRLRHNPAGLAAALRAFGLGHMPDLWPALDRIVAPVRLIVGSHDTKFAALAVAMTARLARGRVTVVEGAGHNVALERPDALAAILAED